MIHDPAVEVRSAPGQEMPATEPSGVSTTFYRAMQGATDGSFLRQKEMAVYGAPLFLREGKESRAHGNDERISVESLGSGANLLMKIVTAVAQILGDQLTVTAP